MAEIAWSMKGPSFGNCNCAWGCPCQFNQPPTHGTCHALGAMLIDEGHYGDVSLTGLQWVNTYNWPNAIHEGNGIMQSIIDEKANDEQRAALTTILRGEAPHDEPIFLHIFASTMTTILDPLFLPIEFQCDPAKCEARVVVPGMIESTGTPMSNPVTGDIHRAKLVLPGGMEFAEAECGSGSTTATGEVKLDFSDTWGQFAYYNLTEKGVVR